MNLPIAVPQMNVNSVREAADYYIKVLGFHLDWISDEHEICGLSQGQCCLYLTTWAPEARDRHTPTVVWLNRNDRNEVDALFKKWQQAGATVISAPEDKPWNLHEFTIADLDGNRLRVFYDFTREKKR